MKKICILYTGGTIGMVKTPTGYAPQPGYLRERLEAIEELSHSTVPAWDMVELSPLLDSSDMTICEWNRIAEEIGARYESYDGFVVLHGTDTMAYTASALSFVLENLAKPVILTGAQIPLCELRSDARDNLIASMLFAADGRANEVCLYFGGRLMRGNRTTKYSADGFSAFRSPNCPYLADAGIELRYSDLLLRPKPTGEFRVRMLREVPIGVIKVFPGIQFDLFASIMTEKLKGIVIETFGAGNIPTSRHGEAQNDALLPIIRKAEASGTVIVVCTQCPQGKVSLGAYAASYAFKQAGAVSGGDLTTEAAVAKLYYLFSCGLDTKSVEAQMETDLRGEMSV